MLRMKKEVANIRVVYKTIYKKAAISKMTSSTKWMKIRVSVKYFKNIMVFTKANKFKSAR